MEDLALAALDEADRFGVSYADVRTIRQRTQQVSTRDGVLQEAREQHESGFGVRVLVNGAWGFAAHEGLDRAGVGGVVGAAVEAGRAAAKVNRRQVELAPCRPAQGTYRTPLARDPFSVSLHE